MAQFYTLEEAARALGMSPEELKAKAQSRDIRAFLDSGSWRFRVADIDELARRRGMGSDPDLALSDIEMAPSGRDPLSDSVEIDLSEFQLGVTTPAEGRKSDQPTSRVSDDDILLDDLNLPPQQMSNSSSTIIGMEPSGKRPSDSDVRLVPDESKDSSDSDVRLAPSGTPEPNLKRSESDVTLVSDDSGSTPGITDLFKTTPQPEGKRRGSSQEVPTRRGSGSGSSDFDLGASRPADAASEPDSGSDLISALQPDSGSDFELQPESGSDFELSALDASDDFDVQPTQLKPSDSDVTAAEPAASGINLGRPSDSGISLQNVGGLGLHEDHESIELAPIEDDAVAAPPKKPAAPAKKDKADLSKTALPIKGGKDLFEDTDFEVDALDSGQVDDKTMQLDAASDFELEDDADSGSQVFALDEDDVDQSAATAMAPAVRDDEDEDMGPPSVESSADELDAWGDELGAAGVGAGAAAAAAAVASPALTSAGPQAEWGGLWVGLLGFATFLTLMLAFISFDLVRNQYEWRSDTPASGLVRMIADTFGG
jgi:hypothetical protein